VYEVEHSPGIAIGRSVLRGSGKRRLSLGVILGILVTFLPQASLFAQASGGTTDTFSILKYDQCANGAPPSTSTACPGGWINGELNAQNSHYAEDQVVPQRAVVNLPAEAAVTHTMTISYLDRQGGATGGTHAYDSLSTWNYTQTTADRCQGLTGAECPAASTLSTFPIPSDPQAVPPSIPTTNDITAAHEIPGVMTMYNATITAVSVPIHSDPLGSGDDYATETITFIPMFSNGGDFQLLFGGHLAASTGPRGWGVGLGAGSISGSPYHILLTAFDTATIGSRDNQIQSGAIIVPGTPAFTISKTASPTTTTPGGLVTYKFTVTNTGTASGVATVTDTYAPATITGTIPGGCTDNPATSTLTCTTGTLAVGASQTFTYTATMPTSFTTGSGGSGCGTGLFPVIDNVVVTGGATATATVCVTATPGFTISKTASPTTTTAGGLVTYKFTVTNTGTAPGIATVTDTYAPATITGTIPAGCSDNAATSTLTCTTGTLNPGASQTFTYTATMPTSFTTGSGGSGCGTGLFPVIDNVVVTGGATATATVCVNAAPAFIISKTASPTTTTPGSEVTYTFTVTNTGTAPGTATVTDTYAPATITGTIPAGCTDNAATSTLTCTTGTLAVGASQGFTYTATMPTTFTGSAGPGCGTGLFPVIDNVVVTGGATASATVCVTAAPAFSITKSATPTTSTPGGLVTYTVTVTNTGNAPGVATVTDTYAPATLTGTLPSGCTNTGTGPLVCTTTSLDPAASETFVYTALMPLSFPNGSPDLGCGAHLFGVLDTVVVTGGDTAKAIVCVSAAPAFSITKTASPTTTTPGGLVTYTVTVTNTGNAPGVATVTDIYAPAILTGTLPSGCTNTGTGPLVCTTSTLDPATSETFVYTALMPLSFPNGSPDLGCGAHLFGVLDTVVVTGGNTATATVCVSAAPAFTITKTAGTTTSTPGAVVTYTIVVTNTGTAPGTATVTDTYAPATLTGTLPSGCTNTGTGPLVCTTTSLDPAASETFAYTAAMPASFTGTPGGSGCSATLFPVVDTVVVSGGATASATVCVVPTAVLGINLTQTPPTTPVVAPQVLGTVVAPQVLGTVVAPQVLGTTFAQTLPFTGFNTEWLLLAAFVLFAAGSVLILVANRRRGLRGES
jgi:uncharacterized repeat protein (TIGR01451 family)